MKERAYVVGVIAGLGALVVLAVVGSLGRALTVACMARGCAIWFYDMEHDGFSLDDKRQRVGDNGLHR